MEKPEPSIALVDADILSYRIGFSSENETEKICLARVTEWFAEVVFMELGCKEYKAYITGKDNFRKDIAVTQPYKGNRAKMAKPRHFEAIRSHLKRLGAEETEGQEADDAIAIEATKQRDKVFIVSIDKDFLQVPGWHYNFVKKEKRYVDDEEALKQFYKQVLMGDRVDNIKGVKGIGPKTADKLIDECKTEEEMWEVCINKHGSVERAIEDATLLYLRRKENEQWKPPV